MQFSNWFLLFVSFLPSIDAVVTCGGFAKMDMKMDYSFIKVHLFTSEGLLKYSTECAPNGYYFIPVYDKGSFYLQIEGPNGWAFEPATVPFEVSDDGEKGCSDDIDFTFIGFALSGQVNSLATNTCKHPKSGPEGIKLSLYRDSDEIRSTLSGSGGGFQFERVFPGTYTIQASHSHLNLKQSEQNIKVDVSNAKLKTPFIVLGYNIKGNVLSSNEGIEGVDIFLFTQDKDAVFDCEKPKQNANVPEHGGFLSCVAQSSETGEYMFTNIPCGSYILVPYYKRTHTTFVVAPHEARIVVGHDNLQVDFSFQVMGFSVNGRLIDSRGTGIAAAKIVVNGEEKTTSDENGYYKLEQVTVGTYNIRATKLHMVFNNLDNIQLSPSVAQLPDIDVISYDVCGVVDSGEVPKGGRKISLHGIEFNTSTETDNDGRYCFMVVPGAYEIVPSLSNAEEAKGILLSPPSRSITLVVQPILDAHFVQTRVQLAGRVKCIENCDVPISISLVRNSRIRGQESQTQKLNSRNEFIFADVFPGEYVVKVHQSTWCWNVPSIPLKVEYEDVKDIEFVQSGFILDVEVSHDINLTLSLANSGQKSYELTKGKRTFCLPKPGMYQLQPVACYRFEKEVYNFDTTAPENLILQAIDYRMEGSIEVTDGLSQSVAEQRSIAIKVKHSSSTSSSSLFDVEAKYTKTVDKVYIYKYMIWAQLGNQFEITPPISEAIDSGDQYPSSSLLFYPRSQTIVMNEEKCPFLVPSFQARPGLYLTGTVTPSVNGVEIVVHSPQDPNFSLTTYSKEDGSYRAGPLYDDGDYKVEAFSEGYHFVEREKGNFHVLKLGKIQIRIRIGDTPLPGVLLSLSGDGYRNNNQTDENGEFIFDKLFPGQYFIRPLLKEYKIQPHSLTINVEPSSDIVETFTASRTAYSAYGRMLSLNGEPEKYVQVEALQILKSNFTEDGKKQYPRYEETDTDEKGQYRLRGLMPNSRYRIGIKKGKNAQQTNKRLERTSPEYIHVDIESSEVHVDDMIAFRRLSKFDLTGTVEASEPEWLDSIEVKLGFASAPSNILRTYPVSSALPFFEFSGLPQDNYILYARLRSNQRTHTIEAPTQTIHLDGQKHVKVAFSATLKVVQTEYGQSSSMSMLLGIFVIFVVVYRDKAIEMCTPVFRNVFSVFSKQRPRNTTNKTSKGRRYRRSKY